MKRTAREIITPAPDSQYRLLPCKCGSDDVAYIRAESPDWEEYNPPKPPHDMWAVTCRKCGKHTDLHKIRHHAQLQWNGRERPSWDD